MSQKHPRWGATWQSFERAYLLSLLPPETAAQLQGKIQFEGDRLIVECDSPEEALDLSELTYGPLLKAITDLPTGASPVRHVCYRFFDRDEQLHDRKLPLYWICR